jgi:PTH1 family peptidyl-tRNA hydrolase
MPVDCSIKLVVGLGNPGPEYEHTRHNVGAWLVKDLADRHGISLKLSNKFHAFIGQGQIHGHDCRLAIPTTYMNHSGRPVAALAKFYKITAKEILVAHDELDFAPGDIKLKQGGGHGGHNGLRDIVQCLGNQKDFARIRIGIGHPGDRNRVSNYVLSRPGKTETAEILSAITVANQHMSDIIAGQLQTAMLSLHTKR